MNQSNLFENPIIRQLLEKYRLIWSIDHAESLLHWDMETYMPRGGVNDRSIALSELAMHRRKLLLEEAFVSLLERSKNEYDKLNDYEKGVVRVLDREITRMKKIPEKIIGELSKTTVLANNACREAREKNDFEKFKPYLEKIVELEREIAERLGYDEHPYDALLDIYEEDWRSRDADMMFDSIIPVSKKVLEKIVSAKDYRPRHPLEDAAYDKGKAEKLNKEILELLGYPWEKARIDVSPHPFTTKIGTGDVRITTRYEGTDIKRTVFSTIHEFGHALYELQIDDALRATPLATGVSMGVHESQSRFWENIVGRSVSFSYILSELLRKHLPELGLLEPQEIYKYVNTVRPSLIRVDADELTYNFHIVLRYRLEKMLIAGEIKVSELPELWNNMMEELLGIRPRSDKEGVLQDVHWSNGYIGYFPTYSLGNVVSAQVRHYLERDLGRLGTLIESRKFGEIRGWLREKIHKFGSTYSPKKLLELSFGEYVNPDYFNKYIMEKFG
jgi:carboxypeptidase Taq